MVSELRKVEGIQRFATETGFPSGKFGAGTLGVD